MTRHRGGSARLAYYLFVFLLCPNLSSAASINLSQWIVQHGGVVGDMELATDPVSGNRGWSARNALTGGLRLDQGLMLLLPSKLIFSASTVRSNYASDVIYLLQQSNTRIADDHFVIIVIGWMLERARGKFSFWAPCIDLVSSDQQFSHLPRNPFVEMPDLAGLSPYYTIALQMERQKILDIFAELEEVLFTRLPLLHSLTQKDRKALFVWAYLFQLSHGIVGSPDGQDGHAQEMMLCGMNFLNHHKNARPAGPVSIDNQPFWGFFITQDHEVGEDIFTSYDSPLPGRKVHCNTDLFFRYGFVVGEEKERDCFHVTIFPDDIPGAFELGPAGQMCRPEHTIPSMLTAGAIVLQDPINVTSINLYSLDSPRACTYHLLLAVFRREYHQIVRDGRHRLEVPPRYHDDIRNRTRQVEVQLGYILRGQLRVLGNSILELQSVLSGLAATGQYYRTLLEQPGMFQPHGQEPTFA
jgi:hypothetical protein